MKQESSLYTIAAFLVALLIIAGILLGVNFVIDSSKPDEDVLGVTEVVSGDFNDTTSGEELKEENEEPKIEEIYTGPEVFSGDSRSVAVMIDNERGAWPQSGLNSAYMIYEMIIEGGATRFEAFFKKDNLPEKLGPVRSSRHYFLDYAMEHDAIYVHFGWSPLAQSDIQSLKINNINGIYDTFFWREPPKTSYHNAFTSAANLEKYIDRKGYRDEQKKDCIIEYNQKDTDLVSGDVVNNIKIKYSNTHSTSYVYDSESKTYLRSMRGEVHADRFTGERFYAKNILIYKVRDELLPDVEDKGRRELYNIGSGEGYYVTNGKCIPMKWKKQTRSGRTIYTDMNGNELKFNDGITWVQIVPQYGEITMSK